MLLTIFTLFLCVDLLTGGSARPVTANIGATGISRNEEKTGSNYTLCRVTLQHAWTYALEVY